jgi:hypothetical protein
MKVTAAQLKALLRAYEDKLGVIESSTSTRGLGRAAFERMMFRLYKIGLVVPYVHGGFQITDEGRQFMKTEIYKNAFYEAEGKP